MEQGRSREPGPAVNDRAVRGAFRRSFTWRTLLTTLIFDICGPLLTYRVLHAAGTSDVVALLASGAPPALGVGIAAKRHHRLDVIGALVLLGVVIGSTLGVLTHDPRLVLLEGAVPTLLFSLACLVSVALRRPLMFVLLQAVVGTRGITASELRLLGRDDATRDDFRVITLGWGFGFLVESLLKAAVVLSSSTGLALTVSKVVAYPVAAVLLLWTGWYLRRSRRRRIRARLGIPAPRRATSHKFRPRPTHLQR
jgi:predicted lysophospholipase L1 biosynthesis ABC-type transport system permease subunit